MPGELGKRGEKVAICHRGSARAGRSAAPVPPPNCQLERAQSRPLDAWHFVTRPANVSRCLT